MAQASIMTNGASCVFEGVDINTCTDDFKLNELLDSCNDYETRRKIRARIKTLIGDKGGGSDEEAAPSAPAKSVDESVVDWVRRQAAMTQASGVQINLLPEGAAGAPDVAGAAPTGSGHEGGGELFDSGTESGEDSTTQSNHSQSDLNSFMADLAKLSLDTAASTSRTVNLNASPQEFLKQVDSVLDRLKSSLNSEDAAETVKAEHSACGDEQLKVLPNQQSELISLIDRLQTSLHHLQSNPQPTAAPPPAVQSSQPVVQVQATPVHNQTTPVPAPVTPTQQKEAEKGAANSKPPNSVVKLRAQSFAAAASSKPATLARPSSFYRSPVSSGSSLRSSSEPASPNPSPTPHKVQWRSPEFLAGSATTGPVSHKPIWCQAQPATQNSKIVLEKSGIRGRFVPPELSPVPTQEKKSPVHQVQSPSASLHRMATPSVRSRSQPPLQRLQLTQQPVAKPQAAAAQSAQPEPESPVQSPKTPAQSKNLPWKVKLAKKKQASNSSLNRPLDGATSVDLRNTIKLAAHRKSVEDLSSLKGPTQPPGASYPLLKQKSLGEIYTPQPKPFVRSESVGAHDSRFESADQFKSVDFQLKKLNFPASRSSSTDRASDWSTSAPPTPMSPEAPGVVVSASIGPSPDGNWMMTSAAKTPLKKQESVASSSSEVVQADEAAHVVTGVLRIGQKEPQTPPVQPAPLTRKPSSNDLSVDPSAELFTPAEMLQIAIHKAAIKASLVQQEEDRKKLTRSESVETAPSTKGNLSKSSSAVQPVQPVEPVPQTPEKPDVNLDEERPALDPDDPSAKLFTPAESLQIAIHKAAIKASLSQQEEARKKTERSNSVDQSLICPAVPKEKESVTAVAAPSCDVPNEKEPVPAVKAPSVKAPPPDDPSSILFTPAESLQIAIHKAAIKASLNQQEEARKRSASVETPPSPDSLSASPQRSRSSRSEKAKSKSSLQKAAAKPEVKRELEQAEPQKQEASTAQVKPVPKKHKVQQPAKVDVPEAKSEQPRPLPEGKPEKQNAKTLTDKAPEIVQVSEEQTKTGAKAPEVGSKPSNQSTPKAQSAWKDRAKRSNTIALLEASPSSSTATAASSTASNKFQWQPKPDAGKTGTDRKLQELFKKNADQHGDGYVGSYRPRALEPGNGKVWTNKFSNLKKAFEQQPTTEQLNRRSSADSTDAHPHVTSGQLKVHLAKASDEPPVNRVFIPAPHPLAESKPANVFLHHESHPAIKVTVNATSSGSEAFRFPPEQRLRQAQVSAARLYNLQQDVRSRPEVKQPLPRDRSSDYISAVTYSQSVRPEMRPEVKTYNTPVFRDRSSDSIRMTTKAETVRSSSTGRTEHTSRRPEEPLVARITVQPQPMKPVQSKVPATQTHPHIRRVMKNRSCSSVRTQSSFRSDSKDDDDEDDDKDSIGIIGDDEASSSDESSSDDEAPIRPTARQMRQAEPGGLKTLNKILKKHCDDPVNPPMAPLIVHPPPEQSFRNGSVSKSHSSRELRSAGGSLDEHLGYSVSRTLSSAAVRPSLTLSGLSPHYPEALPHYVEPEGPVLVGLVARNVARRSSSSNSVLSSNMSLHPSPTNPLEYSGFLARSASSSRLVTEAKQQLERRPEARPRSLIIPSPTDSSVRKSIGSKQYEASLSPDSAEKKQKEVMAFFEQNQKRQQQQQHLQAQHQQQPPAMMLSASYSVAVRSSSAAPVMMNPVVSRLVQAERVPFNRQSSLDASGSDVDEVFNRILADNPPTPDVRTAASSPLRTHQTSSSRPAELLNRNSFGTSTVQSRSEVTVTRQSNFTRGSGGSAFSKFQQLDQSVKSSTRTVTGPWGGSSSTSAASGGGGLNRSASGVKDFLLQWCQTKTNGYQNVQIENFSSSWNDGMAFCALIHHYYPDAFDFSQLEPKNRRYNFTLAFKTAEDKAGIAPLLDVDDMVAMQRPDWKCVFTYVQSFYRRFKDE